ncbi:MAG: MucB/RseB C-terminal domain-containing protein [Chitinivorax sp.]
MRGLFALLFVCYCGSALAAEVLSLADATAVLKRVANASRKTSFLGTYLHQHGAELETFRIARVIDAEGELEKREPLEGVAREIVRSNGQVACFLPEMPANPADVKRNALTKLFPALVNDDAVGALAYFSVTRLPNERVVGVDAQVLLLEPKDTLRYARKLWFDPASGMLLKIATLSRKSEVIEQYAFTELTVGGVERRQAKPRYPHRIDIFATDKSRVDAPKTQTDSGWEVRGLPAGYRVVRESKVAVGNRLTPVSHMWLSDGWGAVSVFIEPLPKPVAPETPSASSKPTSANGENKSAAGVPHMLINQGVVNVYTRNINDISVVVMGDVPEAVVTAIGNGIAPKSLVRQTQ